MMLSELWLSEDSDLQVTEIVFEDRQVIMIVSSLTTEANCPYCGVESSRVNNHYYRRPKDIPFAGYAVQLQMKVRCFFCENAACKHYSFAERFPAVVKPYARRTNRLSGQQSTWALKSVPKPGLEFWKS